MSTFFPFYITALMLQAAQGSAGTAITSTLYNPQHGSKYYFEAQHSNAVWPECSYRFVSYTSTCDMLDLWQGAGANQEITLRAATDNDVDAWKLETDCGLFVDYSKSCGNIDIGTGSESAGDSNIWRLVPSGNFAEWHFEAIHRSECQDRFLTFNSDCNVHTLVLGDINRDFLMHPVAGSVDNPVVHHIATSNNQGCADPFVWKDPDDIVGAPYKMICTGGSISLYSSDLIGRENPFTYDGVMLGEITPDWASDSNRWAPENIPLGNGKNLAIFSSPQLNGVHRLGAVMSVEGVGNRKWNTYSANTLGLGDRVGAGITNNDGGDIDAHFFTENGKTYILWKTDDNAVGMLYTRLWINEVSISLDDPDFLQLIGEPVMILDSTALWWVDSWVDGGSLIEGPQLIKKDAYYYLFFAAGKYCQPSYAQGVARSMSIFGPYTKLGVPILSTGTVGVGSNGDKLIGPGHASFVQDQAGTWFSIFHASEGLNCNRRPYVEKLLWTDDNWPVVVTPTSAPICSDEVVKFKQNSKNRNCKWINKKQQRINKYCAKKKNWEGGERKLVCSVCCETCSKCATNKCSRKC